MHPRGVLKRPSLLDRIRSKKAVIAVVGLGYVGLPLARLFAARGFRVLGFDSDPAKVRALKAGKSYIASVPALNKRFEPSARFARLAEADAIVICVPTPLTDRGLPDLTSVRRTADVVARHLRRGQLVVLESTTYPGTTREELLPRLRKSGVEFLLAYAPERQDPGNRDHPPESIPRIVAGIDDASRRAAAALYRAVVPRVVEVETPEVAEAAKLLENIYRCVNIALVNELKIAFDRMGIDVWKVIEAAATKPFGFQAFRPGPGPGGHCIPIDPVYLAWKAERAGASAKFIRLAGEVNAHMPVYVVDRLEAALKKLKGARVLLLGISYKKDVGDPRGSPAYAIANELVRRGARPAYHDPFFPKPPAMRHYRGLKLRPAPLTEESLASFDAVVVVTDHSSYDFEWIARHARLVVDTRHAVPDGDNVIRA
ncbi:MAG TPA: nucleotide sugar dehydrogenase [Planctomycetota bacterium]|nr:nucleotide sugar dehydrogenase [Planctomycetota bacterium]